MSNWISSNLPKEKVGLGLFYLFIFPGGVGEAGKNEKSNLIQILVNAF